MKKSIKLITYALNKLGYTNFSEIDINSKSNEISFFDKNTKNTKTILKTDIDHVVKMSVAYDIILVMGQSNTCYGTGLDPDIDTSDTDVKQMGRYNRHNYEIIDATEPLHNHHVLSTVSNKIGFAMTFAKLYKNDYLTTGRKIVIIPCGKASSGFINNWWNPGDSLYEDAVFRTNKLLNDNPNNRLVAILWQQGEAEIWENQNNFQSDLDNMITNLRNDINGDISRVPFLLGGMVPYYIPMVGGWAVNINNIIKDTENRLDFCGYVDPSLPSVIENIQPEIDSIHYDAQSQRKLGQRYFSKFQTYRKTPIGTPIFKEIRF